MESLTGKIVVPDHGDPPTSHCDHDGTRSSGRVLRDIRRLEGLSLFSLRVSGQCPTKQYQGQAEIVNENLPYLRIHIASRLSRAPRVLRLGRFV